MDPAELHTVIAGCRQGDRSCQRRLFHAYRERVARIVGGLLLSDDRADIEDAIQRAYVEIFRTIRLFEGRSSFDTWVYRICGSVCMSRLRRKYRQARFSGRVDADEVGDRSPDPERVAESRETLRIIRGALGKINPERRTAFVLAEVEGCSISEVAAIMGCAEGTAKSRLFRARADLERLLRKRGLAGDEESRDGTEVAAAAARYGLAVCAFLLAGIHALPFDEGYARPVMQAEATRQP